MDTLERYTFFILLLGYRKSGLRFFFPIKIVATAVKIFRLRFRDETFLFPRLKTFLEC